MLGTVKCTSLRCRAALYYFSPHEARHNLRQLKMETSAVARSLPASVPSIANHSINMKIKRASQQMRRYGTARCNRWSTKCCLCDRSVALCRQRGRMESLNANGATKRYVMRWQAGNGRLRWLSVQQLLDGKTAVEIVSTETDLERAVNQQLRAMSGHNTPAPSTGDNAPAHYRCSAIANNI